MIIRALQNPRLDGFRAICPCVDTLTAAIDRLASDGHLGQRKCAVSKNRSGKWSVRVYKGGKTKRVFQGDGVGARVTKSLGAKMPEHAWLEVPKGNVVDARHIVSGLVS